MTSTAEKPLKGHYDLYRVVNTMEYIIREQAAQHSKTKFWKHLIEMVEELREIQSDWAQQKR